MRDALWLKPIAALINRLLSQDLEFFSSLHRYHHYTCAVHFDGLNLNLYITLLPDHIHLSMRPPHKIHCHIQGAPFTLLRIMQDAKARTTNTGIKIKGDVDFAEALLKALHHAEIDWEEIIAQISNDHIAGAIAHLTRLTRNFFGEVGHDLRENTDDYLSSDNSMLVSTEAIAFFCNQVDQLKHDSARLDAQLRKLEQQTRLS